MRACGGVLLLACAGAHVGLAAPGGLRGAAPNAAQSSGTAAGSGAPANASGVAAESPAGPAAAPSASSPAGGGAAAGPENATLGLAGGVRAQASSPVPPVCYFMPWLPQCYVPPAVGNVMTLYHQTSPDVGPLILKNGFRPGSRGFCGGAIYFAANPLATYTKALGPDSHQGFIIEAKVDLGNMKHMPPECDQSMTGAELHSQGYDSITFNPGDGAEFVIYSADRVVSMRRYP